jgi:hypothetical protein
MISGKINPSSSFLQSTCIKNRKSLSKFSEPDKLFSIFNAMARLHSASIRNGNLQNRPLSVSKTYTRIPGLKISTSAVPFPLPTATENDKLYGVNTAPDPPEKTT